MRTLWKYAGKGQAECVLCGKQIRAHANGAKVSHARRHVRAGEVTERLGGSLMFPTYVYEVNGRQPVAEGNR